MKKELIFDEGWETNKEFYTFNLDLLNGTLAKLTTAVEEKEYVPVIFKSKSFGLFEHEGVMKDHYNFAYIVVAKEHEHKDFMDYYIEHERSYTFSVANNIEKNVGFVIHEDKSKRKISKTATFSKHDFNLKIANPETEVLRDRKVIRIGEYFDHNTSRINAIDEHYDYLIDFLNFVIKNRIVDKVYDLTEEAMEYYLNEFLTLYLTQMRENKISRYQEEIDSLKSRIEELRKKQNHYNNLNEQIVRTRN